MFPSPLPFARAAALCALATLAPHPASAQESTLPHGLGLSAKYPGDRGISADPGVLLTEDFESGTKADLAERWESVSDEGGAVLAFDTSQIPPASPGKRSLRITAHPGKDEGGHLYSRLKRPADRVFARFYVRFGDAPDAFIHHFVHLGGYSPSTAWPQGGAGELPRGNARFTVGIEPFPDPTTKAAPGNWNFYTYWNEMRKSADGRYWGNGIAPESPLPAPRARWQCVECMIQTNSKPDLRDGELALWLEGEPVLHVAPGTPRGPWTGLGFVVGQVPKDPFEGFRWRTDDKLKVNFFWLLHYVTESALRRHGAKELPAQVPVWFDHIVVAESYVGPIK